MWEGRALLAIASWFGLICVGVFSPAATADAQRTQDIQAGWHIRFRATPASDWLLGTVESLTRDSIGVRVCAACRSETYALADLNQIDARTKVGGSHWVQGAALGALVGIGTDVLSVSRCYHQSRGNAFAGLCGLGALYAPVFALGGAAVGGVIGGQVRKHDWVTVHSR